MADDLFDEFIEYDFTMGADVVPVLGAVPELTREQFPERIENRIFNEMSIIRARMEI